VIDPRVIGLDILVRATISLPAQLLQATAASYNFGTKNIWGCAKKIDEGTTYGNYSSNVVNRMDCLK
jgi:hypothetical protein